jgi:hypothetical protein
VRPETLRSHTAAVPYTPGEIAEEAGGRSTLARARELLGL